MTYEFEYSFSEMVDRIIKAAVTIIKSDGDDYSFIERHVGRSMTSPKIFNIPYDHYSVLQGDGAQHVASLINGLTPIMQKRGRMTCRTST